MKIHDPRGEPVDAAQLLTRLRSGDQQAVEEAYAIVFGGPIGRFVLVHQLAAAKVGTIRPPEMGAAERAYLDGAAAHALGLMNTAGFDQYSVALTVATDQLEGQTHDDQTSFADPEPELGD